MWFLRIFWGWLIRNCFSNRVGGLKYWTEGVIKSSLSWISFIDHFPLFFFLLSYFQDYWFISIIYIVLIDTSLICEILEMNGSNTAALKKFLIFSPSRIYFGFHFDSLRIPNILIGRKFWFWWIGTLIVLE